MKDFFRLTILTIAAGVFISCATTPYNNEEVMTKETMIENQQTWRDSGNVGVK